MQRRRGADLHRHWDVRTGLPRIAFRLATQGHALSRLNFIGAHAHTQYGELLANKFWLATDLIPFMLLGMALLKLGILGANAPPRTYALMLLIGYGIGIPLGLYELHLVEAGKFGPLAFAQANQTYQLSRLAMLTGHLGLALLIIRAGLFLGAQRVLAAVGQMALSNYVAQTIICTVLFFGFGFGLFSALQRHELFYVVGAIWAVELVWSPIWLKYYRFGPLEWAWRSLTYWQRQPFRQSQAKMAKVVLTHHHW
ncbi:MAG: DUF418 domain-containing protein [Deltaproteobacteria bacterium]|nr:MAG: DUF418 domain-containing protein [Deltaproteobacteria bacterium]